MKSMQKKYVKIVKQKNVINGIVVTEYKDLILTKCVDYISDGNVKGYERIERTAKQNKSIMGFTQEY